MRAPLFSVLQSGLFCVGFASAIVDAASASNDADRMIVVATRNIDSPSPHLMPPQVSALIRERLPSFKLKTDSAPATPLFSPSAKLGSSAADPDVVTLPAFLVNSAKLRTPTQERATRLNPGAVTTPNYVDYATRDARLQLELHELVHIADITAIGGDRAMSERIRRETYRALYRQPTPLERAMDRCVNGGRY